METKLGWKNRCIRRRIRRRLCPVNVSYTMFVAPTNRNFWLILPSCFCLLLTVDDVFEHIPGMMKHDVEDDVDSQSMRFIDQGAQFGVCQFWTRSEPRLSS